MVNWLFELFTLEHLGYYVLGVASACVWHVLKARIQHRILVIRWQYMAVPLVLGLVAYMGVQTQKSADCVREFNQALRVRAEITSENDRLSIEQRELIYDWIHSLIFPPDPEIAVLPTDHPDRTRYSVWLTIETDKKFAASIEEQRENDEAWAANPLPPPTCGR